MNLWITRTEPAASRTAERLRALGHTPLTAPLLEVRFLPAAIDLEGVAALVFTSANGVNGFAQISPERALPVLAVGRATALAAREAGFAAVTSADGDGGALARLIAANAPEGEVLFAGAAQPAGDLVGDLKARGVAARAVPVYDTRPTGAAAPEGAQGVLIHSPRAAAELARTLDLDRAETLVAYAISPAALAPLAGLPLKARGAARTPDEDSLLALLPPAP